MLPARARARQDWAPAQVAVEQAPARPRAGAHLPTRTHCRRPGPARQPQTATGTGARWTDRVPHRCYLTLKPGTRKCAPRTARRTTRSATGPARPAPRALAHPSPAATPAHALLRRQRPRCSACSAAGCWKRPQAAPAASRATQDQGPAAFPERSRTGRLQSGAAPPLPQGSTADAGCPPLLALAASIRAGNILTEAPSGVGGTRHFACTHPLAPPARPRRGRTSQLPTSRPRALGASSCSSLFKRGAAGYVPHATPAALPHLFAVRHSLPPCSGPEQAGEQQEARPRADPAAQRKLLRSSEGAR